MVYGLARSGDEYAFLPEEDWVFHFRPRTDPDRVTEIIRDELRQKRMLVVNTKKGAKEPYRPFTIAAQVVDRNDAKIIRLSDLPMELHEKIASLKFKVHQ